MLSPFQQEYARNIEQRDDFEQWCVDPAQMIAFDKPGHPPRPKLLVYYTKDGTLHADRLTDTSVLCQIVFQPAE